MYPAFRVTLHVTLVCCPLYQSRGTEHADSGQSKEMRNRFIVPRCRRVRTVLVSAHFKTQLTKGSFSGNFEYLCVQDMNNISIQNYYYRGISEGGLCDFEAILDWKRRGRRVGKYDKIDNSKIE